LTARRPITRAEDVKDAIEQTRLLLAGRTMDEARSDRVVWAAFERFLEIVSEASRHIPDDWKRDQSEIPWRQVADLGNRLRHVYRDVNPQALWLIYERDLDPLEAAIDAMIAAHAPKDPPP
jgi:uncharacterized protein with HEPN domain